MKKLFFLSFFLLVSGVLFGATENFTEMQVTFNGGNLTIPDTGYSYAHPCVADFDNDGDLDVVVGINYDNLIYYRNEDINASDSVLNGIVIVLATRSLVSGLTDVYGNTIQNIIPTAGDLDGDGLVDLVIGASSGDVFFLKNTGVVNGVPTFTNEGVLIDVSNLYAAAPALVDIDGDGDLDLFIGYSNGEVDFYENTGDATTYSFALTTQDILGTANVFTYVSPTFADINGDGVKDLLLGKKAGTISYFTCSISSGTPVFTKVTDSFGGLSFAEFTFPFATDFENDGKIELLVGQSTGQIALYTDISGTITNLTDMFCSVDFISNAVPFFLDIDGDGDSDLLLAYGSTVALLENTSANGVVNFDFKEMVFLTTSQSITGMDLWDYDNDGDLDLFIGTSSGGVGLLENTGTSGGLPVYTEVYSGNGPFYNSQCFDTIHTSNPGATIVIRDFDGDGDMDFIVGDQYGLSAYYENKDIDEASGDYIIDGWQQGNFVLVYSGASTSSSYFPFLTASYSSIVEKDVDGDGDWDFYFTGMSGQVYKITNTGTLSAPNFVKDSTPLPSVQFDELSTYNVNTKISIADLDGDGWFDMALAGKEGGIKFYKNDMPQDTTPPTSPGNLTGQALSESKIKLNWDVSTDVNGTGVKAYVLKRYQAGTLEQTIYIDNPVASGYLDSGLVQETTYDYEIYAIDYAGNQSTAATVQVQTGPPPYLDHFEITVPTDVVGSTFDITVKAISNYGFVFDSLNDTVTLAPSEGTISPTTLTLVNGVGTASLTYSNDAATDNIQLTITVSYNTVSNTSAAISVDIIPPTTPTLGQATANSATSVTLTWSIVTDTGGAPSYYIDVYRNGTKLITVNGTATSYTDNSCTANTTYTYYLKARDSVGNVSAASNSLTVTTPQPAEDTTPPTTPTGLYVVSKGETFVAIKWNPSTDEGGSGLAGYEIYRDASKIATVTAATTTYTDDGLNPGTQYVYHVRAFDNAGNYSYFSDALTVTTATAQTDTVPPTTPSNLTATAVDDYNIRLSWTGSTDSGGSGLSGYKIYRSDVDNFGRAIAFVDAGETTYTNSNLTPGTTYTYKITAVDNAGNESGFSNEATATTPDSSADTQAPSVPTNLQAEALSPTDARISWDASTDNVAVDYYEIYVVEESDNPFQDYTYTLIGTTSETNFVASNLNPGQTYSFAVDAVDTSGNKSRYSEIVSVTMPDAANDTIPPYPPENVRFVQATSTSVIIAYDAAQDNEGGSGIKQYHIFKNNEEIAVTDSLMYEDTDVMPQETYSYFVKSEDWNGNLSEPSNTISTVIPLEDNEAPTPPSNLTFEATPEYVVLTWGMSYDEISGVDHYEIQKINSPFKTKEVKSEIYATTTATMFKDDSVTPGAKYVYYVFAVDRSGNKSAPASVTVEIPLSGQEDYTLYFPHIDVSDFWWTGFAVVNPGDSTAHLTFRFYDANGNEVGTIDKTLEPKGKIVDTIRNFFNNSVPEGASWFKIETDTKLDGFELFGTNSRTELVGVKIFSKPSTRLIYPEIMVNDTYWTGAALINIDDSQATVVFKAYDANGNEVAVSSSFTIPANGKKVDLAENFFDSLPSESAYVVAESDKNIIGFELYGYTSHVGLAGLSALPLEDQSAQTTSSVLKTEDLKAGEAPQNLTGIVTGPTSVQLSWDAPSTTPDSYRIYEVEIVSTPFGTSVNQVQLWGETTDTAYTVTGLTPDTDYQFAVYAVYGSTESSASNVITVHTLAGDIPTVYTYVCPRVEENYGGTTSVVLINVDSDTATVKYQLLGQGGEIIAETSQDVDSMHKVRKGLSELFGEIPAEAKAVKVVSSGKLIVWENFEYGCDNGNANGYYDTLYAFDRALSEVNFTHIAPETNWWNSYVAVWNLADYSNGTKFTAYGLDGSVLGVYSHQIAPGDVLVGEIHDYIPDDSIIQNIGWVKVSGDYPMNGYFAFSDKDNTVIGAVEGQ